ncbi:diguanylate cyclase [Pseudocitrobacter cyperus]|uniref:diguanylate cyclase n=1 Tax=Pseudocitrobacter cyperus TaxID=3112843 RepID=A0ABV0HFX3_9ENTR
MNRKLKAIDELLDGLNRSVGAHYHWLVQAFKIIAKHERNLEDVSSLEAHNFCQFGCWVNKHLATDTEDKGFLLTIHEKHIHVHEACRQLVESILQNEIQDSLFNDFEHALQGFVGAITCYQTHLLQLRISYDALTSLPLRRILDESFDKQVMDRSNGDLYVMILDIDHFKRINDTYGHVVGDEVLRAFAQKLQSSTRNYEPVYRFGGEEFIVILKAKNEAEAMAAGIRITRAIEHHQIMVGQYHIPVTVTSGLTRAVPGELLRMVLERADAAMYVGKQSGRNRCMFIDEQGSIERVVD